MCSGAGTAESSRAVIESIVQKYPLPHSDLEMNIQTVALWEYAANCNQLLFDNHRWCTDTIGRDHPMPHFFGDILGLNPGGTFNAADSYKIKKQRIKESELMEYQLCNTHSWSDSESEYCCVPGAHFGCSGLPCTDMSRAGKRKKRFGPTNSIYMTHGKYTEAKKLTSCIYDPDIMKDKIAKRVSGQVRTVPSDYFLAQQVEVELEARALAEKRSVQYRPYAADLSYLLTKREKQALETYKRLYEEEYAGCATDNPDLVVFLGDNPNCWRTWSAKSKSIPTFRRNSKTGLMWCPYLRRFMVAREKLAALGWPVSELLAANMQCKPVPAQDILRAADLAGNAMHFTTWGADEEIEESSDEEEEGSDDESSGSSSDEKKDEKKDAGKDAKGKKPKGEIRSDLLKEYENLGRPGAGMTVLDMIRKVEAEMSRHLEFQIEKGQSGQMILTCGKSKVTLPKNSWKNQIYKEQSGIPFISDGKKSVRCIDFFQDDTDEKETPDKPTAKKPKTEFAPLNVPLPGTPASSAQPGTPLTVTGTPKGGGSEPELTPDGADKTKTTGEKKPVCACNYFREGMVDGYTVFTSVQDSKTWVLFHGGEEIQVSEIDGSSDWKLVANTKSGKHEGEVFLHSPSGSGKPQWVTRLKFDTMSKELFNKIQALVKQSKKDVADAKKKEEEDEAKKKKDEDEAKKKKDEEDAAKKKDEEDAAKKKKDEEEAKAKAAEAQDQAAKEKAAEEKKRKHDEAVAAELERQKKQKEDSDAKAAEEETKRKEAEKQREEEEEKHKLKMQELENKIKQMQELEQKQKEDAAEWQKKMQQELREQIQREMEEKKQTQDTSSPKPEPTEAEVKLPSASAAVKPADDEVVEVEEDEKKAAAAKEDDKKKKAEEAAKIKANREDAKEKRAAKKKVVPP
ncbi:unnamed protein product [Durusdinium trenchii]|uniref:Uncharacterized protein n=1 Tax=Durusdinium trenchii TaxID=1381693 RepID=A0ABP0I0N2_9DINO